MGERFVVTDDLLADRGLRFVNFLIDLVARFLLTVMVLVFAYLLGFEGFLAWMETAGFWGEFTVGILMALLYFNAMEIPLGVTIGKLVTGTVVVDPYGELPDRSTILTRSLCRIIPFEPFSCLSENGRGWHDTIPDVYVVRKRDLEEARQRHRDVQGLGRS